MADRDIDVVVFGATSVTGRRVASYLAERAEPDLQWAAAARDLAKLERTMEEQGAAAPVTLTADVDHPGSLAEMASRTRVVLNLVGPYARFGTPVIEACLAEGAHYVDLTGELPFVRRTIDAFHAEAERSGVKLVQPCGFESLPPDLAVLLAAEAARERWQDRLEEAEVEVAFLSLPSGIPRPSDVISGGTLQSAAEIAADPDAARMLDPALLVTDATLADRIRASSPIEIAPRRRSGGVVIAPMAPGAFVNPAVIHRSVALLAAERGETPVPLRYREGIALAGPDASLPLRYAAAGMASAVQVGLGALARAREPARRRVSAAMRSVLPGSGFGPDPERAENWRWRLEARCRTTGGRMVEVRLDADGHPGYATTARMLGEAGLLLAEADATPPRAGCLTPATALGSGHIDRFRHAGMRFSVAD